MQKLSKLLRESLIFLIAYYVESEGKKHRWIKEIEKKYELPPCERDD